MSKFFLFFLLTFKLLILISVASTSQSIIKLPFQKKIGSDNGLSSNNVNKILQDKFGFIWISTLDGLNRYDGNEFIIYNKSTTANHLLLGNAINDIVEDTARNILWVTTYYGGINGIDMSTGNVLHTLRLAITDSGFHDGWLRCLNICRGKLWIGTDNGLTVYDPSTGRFIKTDTLPFKKYKQQNINAVFTDQYNHVWVFLPDYGLVIYSGITYKILQHYTCNQLGIQETQGHLEFLGCFTKINNKSFVLGTDHGFDFLSYDSLGNVKSRSHTFALNRLLVNIQILSCKMDKNQVLWFSTVDHLYKYDLKNNKYEIVNDIGKQEQGNWLSSIFYIFFDRQNNLWLGTARGIAFCRNIQPAFIPYLQAKDASLKIDRAYYVYPFSDSVIYVCADDGFYEVNTFSDDIIQTGDHTVYYYLFKNIDNKIIICGNNGLFVYASKKMNPIASEYPELSPIKNEVIVSTIILGDSVIIMGSLTGKGIQLWNIKSHLLQNIQMANGEIENPIVNYVYKDSHNKVWILFDNAFAILDVNNNNYFQRFQINDPDLKIPLSMLFDICEVKNDYWLAVYGKGVIQIDSNHHIKKIYSIKEGLSNTSVFKVLPYHDSLIFVTSNNGLFSIDIESQKVHQYLKDDGLNANSFDQGCGYIQNDIFYVGGKNGFSVIRPKLIKSYADIPLLYVDKFKFQFKNNSVDTFNLHFQNYAVPNNTLQTTISFSALNYANSNRVTYAYKIDELNDNWINLGSQNFVNLIGLSPDTYTLEVKAANEDGVWCEPKQLTLTFLPKWYQTAWFKAAIILFAGGLFYSFYRYRISQLKKQQQIRHEIANDLHDDLGATLNSIRIFTRLAETSPQKEEYFKQIKESLNHAYSGLRDMIWVLDDAGDTVEDLLKRIKQFAEPVAHANNIHVHFSSVDSNNIDLNKTEKRNLLLIAKEGINNCIKYAGCKNIYVSLTVTDGKITLITQDDGCGFNEKEIIPGHGLKNIQERAKQIHYTASIESAKDAGTKIIVVKK